jgi:uncharacterized protein (TIGR03067 family)
MGVLMLGSASISRGDEAQDEAIKRDRQRIEGTWRIVGLEVNGSAVKDEDARRLTVVNKADGTWTLLSEGKKVSSGTSSIDPSKTPKTIDFTPTDGGGQGNRYLGIYELGDKTRRMCFAPPEKSRPTEFKSTQGSEIIVVRFERDEP